MPPSERSPNSSLVKIFISYAAADRVIAMALYEVLKDINKDRVRCFLDTETVESGTDWEKKLITGLEEADWLVCIYTGEQSEFCGFEIGVFTRAHNITPKTRNSRVVCLYDVELATLPQTLRKKQHRKVTFPPDPSTTPIFDEADFYGRSELGKFFRDVYKYKNLYPATDISESQRQLQALVRHVKKVTDAFKTARGSDIRSNTPTQLGLTISVASPQGQRLTSIPADAVVTGTSQSFALFRLRPLVQEGSLPTTDWGTIRQNSTPPHRTTALWIESLESDMLAAAAGQSLQSPEATFATKDKIYRALLSRHILFENGNARFEVLFVETLPRAFIGQQETSVLLAGIVLASRFRFAYLEESEKLKGKFADTVPLEEFERNCLQLHYDLERFEHEAVEHGLLDPLQLVKAFGEDKKAYIEGILRDAAEYRKALFEVLPAPGARLDKQKRIPAKEAIALYLTQIETMNSDFLSTALDIFRHHINIRTKCD